MLPSREGLPGAGRHGPALLSLGQERGPRGHGRRLWVSGRLLRYWCAHTVLVRGRAPALAWRVTDGPRSRLVTWGGGQAPTTRVTHTCSDGLHSPWLSIPWP